MGQLYSAPIGKVNQSSVLCSVVPVGSMCLSSGGEPSDLSCMLCVCAVLLIWSEVYITLPCLASRYLMIYVISKQACMFADCLKPNSVVATPTQNPLLSAPFILSCSHKLAPCSLWGQRSSRVCTYLWGKSMAQGMVSKNVPAPF